MIRYVGALMMSLATVSAAELIVIGDSTSDTHGVASNGRPLWVDVVSEGLAQGRADAWRQAGDRGRNFAQGGARAIIQPDRDRLDVPEQIDVLLAEYDGRLPDDALILTFQGGNDLLNDADPRYVADAVRTNLERLIAAGARRIAIGNMANGDNLPSDRFGRAESEAFNRQLARHLADLRERTPGLELVEIDFYRLFEDVRRRPAHYKLANVTEGWSGTDRNVPVADFFWYDDVHMTTSGHAIVGRATLQALAEAGLMPERE